MRRSGFTLIELIVALSIFLILSVMTITMVNISTDAERISSAARQVQSYVLGARDRAIHAGEPRGVRFVLDPNDSTSVNSLLYIGSPEKFRTGLVTVGGQNLLPAHDSAYFLVPDATTSARWERLYQQRLLVDYAPIWLGANKLYNTVRRITDGSGNFLRWRLGRPMAGASDAAGSTVEYALQLQPAVLPNQEPRLLPRGIVIDLDQSQLPNAWSSGGSYSGMDVLFSPRGTITGRLAAAGAIRLVLADIVDVERGLLPGDGNKQGDELIVSINTQTGSVTTHSVDPTDSDSNGAADDPFRFARLGEASQ